MDSKTASIVVIALGALMLLASLTADMTGLGDDAGFGSQQMIGTVVGIVVLGIGAYLYKKSGSVDRSGD
jgi:hypothetical protein